MTQLELATGGTGGSPFDALKQVAPDGSEHWSGRELMSLMDYSRWERFATVINKAKASLALVQGERAAEHHFPRSGSDGGRWGGVLEDFRLTRFGAYLTAMAGDDTKEAVAQARVYFAVKTREAEIAEQNTNNPAIPQSFADALQLAANQAREIERQSTQIAELEPRAAQADHFRKANGLTAIADFANDLALWASENHRAKVLHSEVRDYLGELGLVIRGNTIRNNEPTADAIKRGLMRPKKNTYETDTRGVQTTSSARFTQKGWGYAWDRAIKRIADHGSLRPTTAAERTNP